MIDDGAARVLRQGGRSLLPVGVTRISGEFRRGEMVACLDEQGKEVARGLVNYDAAAARLIAGQSSDRIMKLLGFMTGEELIHRDNMVIAS